MKIICISIFQTTFTGEIEQDILAYILKMESMMFGLRTADVRRLAYQVAERNGIPIISTTRKGALEKTGAITSCNVILKYH